MYYRFVMYKCLIIDLLFLFTNFPNNELFPWLTPQIRNEGLWWNHPELRGFYML